MLLTTKAKQQKKTNLANSRITDMEELEKVVVFAGVHIGSN